MLTVLDATGSDRKRAIKPHEVLKKTAIASIRFEFSVDPNGVGRSTIRGAARIVGVDEGAIRQGFEGAEINSSKLTQMLMVQGFEGAEISCFAEDGIPDRSCVLTQSGNAEPVPYPLWRWEKSIL